MFVQSGSMLHNKACFVGEGASGVEGAFAYGSKNQMKSVTPPGQTPKGSGMLVFFRAFELQGGFAISDL